MSLSDDLSTESTPDTLLVIDAREGQGQRLDQFLTRTLQARLDGISRTRIQRWIALGAVRVDQQVRLPSLRLKGVESIEVEPQPLESDTAFAPDPVPLAIVHQDADITVIDKPAGLVTHPAPGNWRNTLMNGLLHADPKAARLPRAGIVHRLDRDTSGLLVCARSERAFASLTAQLASRQMGRRYLAIACGQTPAQGTVEGNIGRNPKDRMQMAVLPDDQGKHAVTHYRVLERLGYVTLIECILETGRTHQIRVHMKHIGHVLFNDERYGGHEILKGTHFAKYKQFVNNCFDTCPRQALHAMTLGFVHPASGEEMNFTSALPDDMSRLIDKWRSYISNRDLE